MKYYFVWREKAVDMIYFQKSIDNVSQKRFISKVKADGGARNILNWQEDWLSETKQRILINGEESDWHSLSNCVPHASVLAAAVLVMTLMKCFHSLANFNGNL